MNYIPVTKSCLGVGSQSTSPYKGIQSTPTYHPPIPNQLHRISKQVSLTYPTSTTPIPALSRKHHHLRPVGPPMWSPTALQHTGCKEPRPNTKPSSSYSILVRRPAAIAARPVLEALACLSGCAAATQLCRRVCASARDNGLLLTRGLAWTKMGEMGNGFVRQRDMEGGGLFTM
jgi:hypothetical protein